MSGKQLKPPTQERGKLKVPLKLVCAPQSTFSGKTVNVRPVMPVMKKTIITQQLADNEMKKRYSMDFIMFLKLNHPSVFHPRYTFNGCLMHLVNLFTLHLILGLQSDDFD